VVANMADEVVVLYRGRVMESGPSQELLKAPEHPYLKALMHAVPTLSMSPSERLTPLREVSSAGRGLLTAAIGKKGSPPVGQDRPDGEKAPSERRSPAGPVLEVRGL
jgi:ABC-type dipeptide/oligopeptide/nickel transport system ATPase component